MISFWMLAIIILSLTVAWLAWPFLRRTEVVRTETDAALAVYRDQSEEVQRDLEAGLISQSEYDAAQREIEARTLRAARSSGNEFSIAHRSPLIALVILVFVSAGSFGGYLWIGNPDLQDQPLAARQQLAATHPPSQDDQEHLIQEMVAGLAAKLEENPNNPDGWTMLVRSYATLGQTEKAKAAFARAENHYASDPALLAEIKKNISGMIGM